MCPVYRDFLALPKLFPWWQGVTIISCLDWIDHLFASSILHTPQSDPFEMYVSQIIPVLYLKCVHGFPSLSSEKSKISKMCYKVTWSRLHLLSPPSSFSSPQLHWFPCSLLKYNVHAPGHTLYLPFLLPKNVLLLISSWLACSLSSGLCSHIKEAFPNLPKITTPVPHLHCSQ